MKQEKILFPERLRILAILFVLFNHTNGQGFFRFANAAGPAEAIISLLLSVLCKAAVPLFFMISGYLLLDRTESLRQLIFKRIFRYLLVISVMSVLYCIAAAFRYPEQDFHLREAIKVIYRGDIGTYWFLYAYFGCLLALPLLRKASEAMTTELFLYLTAVKLILDLLFPSAILLVLGYQMPSAFTCPIVTDPFYYMLAGSYFKRISLPQKRFLSKAPLCGIMLLCLVFSALLTQFEYLRTGEYSERFLTVLMPIFCCSLFFFCERFLAHGPRTLLTFLGDKVFGIYLLEPLMSLLLAEVKSGIFRILPGLPGAFVWVFFAFSLGTAIVSLIRLIPGSRKFI